MSNLLATLGFAGSALSTTQFGLQVAGNNIANATTEGFNRQSAVLENLGVGGVRAMGVKRAADRFVTMQLGARAGSLGKAQTRSDSLSRLEQRVGSLHRVGVISCLDKFYAAWRGVSANAHDSAGRTEALSATMELVEAVKLAAFDFELARENADEKLVSEVDAANLMIRDIASMNREIHRLEAAGSDANQIRDRRDLTAEKLGETIGSTHFVNQKDEMIVTLSGGLGLVTGRTSQELRSQLNTATGFHDIIIDTGSKIVINDAIGSGNINGLLTVRDEDIANRLTELDTFASDLVAGANAIHSSHFNLDGVDGVPLFTPLTGPVAGAAERISVNEALLGQPSLLAASSAASEVPGNGAGALAMASLESAKVANGDTQTLTESMNECLSALGIDVNAARASQESESLRFEQLKQLQASLTGVSIEEEMIQLSRFQRSFQAASKIIATVDEMLAALVQL